MLRRVDIANASIEDADPGDTAPQYSEEALALEFATRHTDDLRYVAAWSRWYIWDGICWRADETRKVYTLARALCREAVAGVNSVNMQRRIASAKTRAAVVSLAGEDYKLAATVAQWDFNIDYHGGSEMTIDLQTGKCHPPRPEDYITKRAAAQPGGECPLWHKFLTRVTNGDVDLQHYLQRVAGYGLTGHTSEHAIFFLYGTGANGKSVFVNTLVGIMGDYATTAPMEVFIESKTDRHPTELAMLRGARLVVASETQSGRNWNEARIKTMTGGDKIAARFMRGDFFEFVPQFKLMISGNHKPSLRNVDEAMRRRLHLVPFTVTIPLQERDPELTEKLKAEWPGILQWAIDGCIQWQHMGLQPPQAVKDATNNYLEAEDDILSWVKNRCVAKAEA